MVIFRCNNDKDLEFARKNNVWQTSKSPKSLEIGELLAIQLTGTKDIFVIGIATTKMYEDIPYAWPGNKLNFSKTVKFKPIDLKGQWTVKSV